VPRLTATILRGRSEALAAARWLAKGAVLVALPAALAACSSDPGKPETHDPDLNKTRKDYDELNRPPRETKPQRRERSEAAPAVPELAPAVPEPEPPELSPNPRVSISTTEDVPLKEVLFQLARQANVEIEIDPRISGGIIFSAKNRPFLDVIDRIAQMAGLRYSVNDNVVRVEVDTPYQKDYSVPYITMARQTQSRVAISTEVNAPGAEGGGRNDTSSSSVVTANAKADFFTRLEKVLETIVANAAPRGLNATQKGAEQAVAVMGQAGIVSVFGTSQQHEAVKKYLRNLRRKVGAQVLIEAKVVEVDLNEQFSRGVNWRAIVGKVSSAARFGSNVAAPPFETFSEATQGVASFGVDTDNFGALLNLVQRYGTTRTLSSPRLTVLNNQTAILKVAENEIFFELDVEREEEDDNVVGDNDTILSIDSEIQSLPIGLVLAVQPAIDLRQRDVTLTLRPTITRIQGFKNDPAVSILSNNQVESPVPVVETRELDSVLELNSGEIAVLGGLMQERVKNEDTGIPGLAQIPLLGQVFTGRSEETNMIELVVLLRAQILDNPQPTPADERLYQEFTNDPRPLEFDRDGGNRGRGTGRNGGTRQ